MKRVGVRGIPDKLYSSIHSALLSLSLYVPEGWPLPEETVSSSISSTCIRILGMEVKEDDSMKNSEILISNPSDGYHMNINKEMTMMTEDHVKDRVPWHLKCSGM